MNLKTFLLTLCLLSAAACAYALDVPPRPDGYVNDRAGILSPATESKIERVLQTFETKTSNQVILVTFPSLEEESLEDFSIRLAEQWKAGQKGKDNGVILLIFKNERKIRIEVGYGLEGALPDALAGIIISREIAPSFREADYETGVLKGLQSILMAVEGEYRPGRQQSMQQRGTRRQLTPQELAELKRQSAVIFIFVLAGAVILFIFDIFKYRRYLHDHRIHKHRYSFWEWFFRFAMLLAVVSIIFRVMFYMILFSRGGYGGSRGGGGFSGGGGSFGGGGASGGW